MKAVSGFIMAFGFIMAAALISPTQAAMPRVPAMDTGSNAVLVSGGCGYGWHRGPAGYCRPNYYRACPPGWHLGPYGRRCWAN